MLDHQGYPVVVYDNTPLLDRFVLWSSSLVFFRVVLQNEHEQNFKGQPLRGH